MQRPLFGGAITCHIPNGWRDVSDIRQVPDHQECWQDDAGKLLVVEILERQRNVKDDQAAAYFFEDLAASDSNAASEKIFQANIGSTSVQAQLLAATGLPPSTKFCLGVGYQRLKVGRDKDIAGIPRPQQESRAIRVEVVGQYNT